MPWRASPPTATPRISTTAVPPARSGERRAPVPANTRCWMVFGAHGGRRRALVGRPAEAGPFSRAFRIPHRADGPESGSDRDGGDRRGGYRRRGRVRPWGGGLDGGLLADRDPGAARGPAHAAGAGRLQPGGCRRRPGGAAARAVEGEVAHRGGNRGRRWPPPPSCANQLRWIRAGDGCRHRRHPTVRSKTPVAPSARASPSSVPADAGERWTGHTLDARLAARPCIRRNTRRYA